MSEMLRTLTLAEPQALINQGVAHFHHFNDPGLEAQFYTAVGYYRWHSENDMVTSRQSFEKALSLAKPCGDLRQHSVALDRLARLEFSMGNYEVAQMHAREAQKIAHLSGNLDVEASVLITDTRCLVALGNLIESASSCQKGGRADHNAMNAVAEVHRLKSGYLEAHNIHIELLQNASVQQDPLYNAYALLNITELDALIGVETFKVHHNLDNEKAIFSTLGQTRLVNQCETIVADLHLREGNEMVAGPYFNNV
ncbi:hypothetical protein C8R44DRAFT_731411 [Mycena epipterygia]|nr:hypothetical protein C8R44DRAFT_731411 [Mycena epipterygia]